MQSTLRSEKAIPYCPGCGHSIATNTIVKALDKLNINPMDVIIVSDIGCCGLIDPLLNTHSIHGLHGRAAALGMGVAFGLDNPNKKVIAIQGDGGATIGLQNLLEAARHNVNMTLIVQNNMVYGMTGGQISGLSGAEFKESVLQGSGNIPPFDICKLANLAGASFVSRVIIGGGNLTDVLAKAFSTTGFSLVEIVGLCTPYGIDSVKELKQKSMEEISLESSHLPYYATPKSKKSLFESLKIMETKYNSGLKERLSVIIAGSAGEGVQVAADLLTKAGCSSGLKTTKKGEYPITVGTGHSIAEVILSQREIYYTGIEKPDVLIIVSEDGLKKVDKRVGNDTIVIIDEELKITNEIGKIYSGNFRKTAGRKGAVLMAVAYWLNITKAISLDALRDAISQHKHAEQLMPLVDKAIQS